MSRYLVTGGAGFIGSHLVEALLAAGHRVDVLDDLSSGKAANIPEGARLIRGTVTDAKIVNALMAQSDGCFHLAAIASVERCNDEWIAAHTVNMTGAITVMDAARARSLPVVYASSAAVYGAVQELPLAEFSPVQPLSAYGADKLGIELHARAAWAVHGIPTAGFRFFNVYGPRQDARSPYSGVISIFADRLGKGHGITIFGDGSQTRDFVHVSDAVNAMMRAMQASPAGVSVFNVCTGVETSLLNLVKTLGRVLDVEPALSFSPVRPGDIARSVGDPALLSEKLAFKTEVMLADGLRTMLGK